MKISKLNINKKGGIKILVGITISIFVILLIILIFSKINVEDFDEDVSLSDYSVLTREDKLNEKGFDELPKDSVFFEEGVVIKYDKKLKDYPVRIEFLEGLPLDYKVSEGITGNVIKSLEIENEAHQFFEKNKKILGIKKENLKEKRRNNVNNMEYISFEQEYNGIPVYLSNIFLVKSNNKWVLFNSYYHNNINVNDNPQISKAQAIKSAKDRLNTDIKIVREGIIIYPKLEGDKTNYYLAYKIDFPIIENEKKSLIQGGFVSENSITGLNEIGMISPSVFVDAHSGEVIDVIDNIRSETVFGNVYGSIFPDHSLQEKVEMPFANQYLDGGNGITDLSGNYNYDAGASLGTIRTALEGPFVKVFNYQQPEANVIINVPPYSNDINWGESDNSYKMEESNLFYHTNFVHDFFTMGQDPFNVDSLNYRMPARVNYDCNCNAFMDSRDGSISFCSPCDDNTPGNECDGEPSTNYVCEPLSLSSDVIYHEYVHKVVHDLAPQMAAVYLGHTGNMNEGYADYFACSLNNNSCLAENFLGMDCMRNCENNMRFPEDYDPEPHTASDTISGSMWDIRQAVGQEVADTLALVALSYDPQTFQELADDFIIADDAIYGNGDLSDGSPNLEIICDSFSGNHGVYSRYCFNFVPLISSLEIPVFIFGNQYFDIEGIAGGINFDHYNLSFVNGSNEIQLTSSYFPTSENMETIYQDFNSDNLKVGKNTFILRAWDELGNNYKYGATIQLFEEDNKEGWPYIVGPMAMSYGSPVIDDFNNDGKNEVIFPEFLSSKVHLVHHNGTSVEGWPISLDSFTINSPSVFDVDNNGQKDMILVTYSTNNGEDVYAINYNGNNLQGWPVDLPSQYNVFASTQIGQFSNGSYVLVTALGVQQSRIFVINTLGIIVDELLFNLSFNDMLGGTLGMHMYITPAIGDIDNDNDNEIILTISNKLYIWENIGSDSFELKQGYPKNIINRGYGKFITSHTVLADLNKNGNLEIISSTYDIFSKNSSLWVFNNEGSLLNGWPLMVKNNFIKDIVIADFYKNLSLEIITESCSGLDVFSYSGEVLATQHYSPLFSVDMCPNLFIGDINNDGINEIATFNNLNQSILILDESLDLISEIYNPASLSLYTSTIFKDLENDGVVDMVSFSNSFDPSNLGMILAYTYDFPEIDYDWPAYRHDNYHTGNYNYDPKLIVSRPQSKIVNEENYKLNGNLKMILQKNVSGVWVDEQIVVDQEITIPASGLIKLDIGKDNLGNQVFAGWNDLNVKADEPGNYRVYGEFDTRGKIYRDYWEFEIN